MSEIANIPFGGINNEPNDYQHQEGSLSLAVNAVVHNGSMRPVTDGTQVYRTTGTAMQFYYGTFLCVHDGRYIWNSSGGNVLCYYTLDADDTFGVGEAPSTILSVTPMGNTLIVLCESEKCYFLWKGDDEGYVSLGTDIPEIYTECSLYCQPKARVSSSRLNVVEGTEVAYELNPTPTVISVSDVDTDSYYSYGDGTECLLNDGTTYRFYNGGQYDQRIWFLTSGGGYSTTTYLKVPSGQYRDLTIEVTGGVYYLQLRTGKDHNTTYTINLYIYEVTTATTGYAPDNTSTNLNRIMAAANGFVQDVQDDDGKFLFPFFVRVGLRMYDGSITHLSAPILMLPNTGLVPCLFTTQLTTEGDYPITAFGYEATLYYRITNSISTLVSEWSDVVIGLVISVTSPIYEYNQGYEYQENKRNFDFETFDVRPSAVSNFDNFSIGTTDELDQCEKMSVATGHIGTAFAEVSSGYTEYTKIIQPSFSGDEIRKNYVEASNFYVLEEIPLDELEADTWTEVDTSDKKLSAVYSWERVQDDQNSHDAINAQAAYVYNSRLHLANIDQTYYEGDNPFLQSGFCYGSDYDSNPTYLRTIVNINEDGKAIDIDSYTGDDGFNEDVVRMSDWDLYWYFYPNMNAKSVTIYKKVQDEDDTTAYTYYVAKLSLEQHAYLNGAFWFGNLDSADWVSIDSTELPNEGTDETLTFENKLLVSDVNNPFFFPVSSRVSVGDGEIYALSSQTKAISEGQFGDYPLIAFCSDGIWALSVNSTGVYGTAKPFSRDVLTNTESITQTDGSILFVTQRGLMELNGGQVNLLSGELEGYNFTSGLDQLSTVMEVAGIGDTDMAPPTDIVGYLQVCKFIYDYKRQMLFVYSNDTDGDYADYSSYGLCYSLRDKKWGGFHNVILYHVSTYTDSLVVMNGAYFLYNLSEESSDAVASLIVTRPLNFGQPETYKTIESILLRGVFEKQRDSDSQASDMQLVVWASNDLKTWAIIGSSTSERWRNYSGTPYKYYRIGVIASWDVEDSINAVTIAYTPRMNNKIR